MPRGRGYPKPKGPKDSGTVIDDMYGAIGRKGGGGNPNWPTKRPPNDPKLHSPSSTGDFSKGDPRFPTSIDKQGHGRP